MLSLIKNYFQYRKDFYTHVALDQCPGTYYLSATLKDNFYEDYSKCIIRGEELFLAEKMGATCPIIGDVDLQCAFDEKALNNDGILNSLYTGEQVIQLISHFQQVLKQKLKSVQNNHLTCFLLEKDPRVEGQVVKHGIHLHFPFLFTSVEDFKKVIFEELKNGNCDLASKLDCVAGKCWLMYGSVKKTGQYPYFLTKIFNHNAEEIDIEQVLSNFKAFDTDGKELEFVCNLEKLPRLLSVNPIGNKTFKLIQEKRHIVKATPDVIVEAADNEQNNANLVLATKLCNVLDAKRADDYSTWWEIGVTLFNIGEGGEEALQLFHQFSSKSEKYDYNGCCKLWEQLSLKPSHRMKRMGSLVFLCRQDNAQITEQILRDWKSSQNHSMPSTEYRIAYEFIELYPDLFLYCSKQKWYMFDKHVWRNLEDATLNFIPLLIKMSDWYRDRFINDPDSSIKDRLFRLIKKLETTAGQKNIISQAAHLYYYSDVHELMDSNPDLIAFQNGVFDLEKMEFRKGMPSDFLSKKMPVAYIKPTDKEYQELETFLKYIFPDSSVLEYFLTQTCEVFVGGNRDKIAMFWTGSGNNGKSVTQKLFEKMLGSYAVKLPTTVITGKKIQSGSASPELVRLRQGVRWGVFEEFNVDEQIEIGILKHLTGNDAIYARQLYEKGEDFTPMFKMVIICNKLPNLKCPDEATWNRIRVIPFESTFSNKAPTDEEEQTRLKHFPCDQNIERHFPTMASTLAYYLLERLKLKRQGKCNTYMPDKVIAATLQYQMKCNKIACFAKSVLEQVVSFEEAEHDYDCLYLNLRDWWKIHYQNSDYPDLEDFTNEMKRLQNNGQFYRIRKLF